MMKMDWRVEEDLNKKLDELITLYGFESEPVLYFAKAAWESPSNRERYYWVAKGWIFDWEERLGMEGE